MERLYALSRSILLIGPSQPVPKQFAMQIAQSFSASAVALYDGRVERYIEPVRKISRIRRTTFGKPPARARFFATTPPTRWSLRFAWAANPSAASAFAARLFPIRRCRVSANLVAIGLERARAQEATSKAEAARQSDELKSTLLDALAHEFKTPLTSIKAASTALLSSNMLTAGPAARTDLDRGRRGGPAKRAGDRSHPDGAHRGRPRAPANGKVIQCSELIESVLDKLEPMVRERNIDVKLPPNLPAVWVDRELIEDRTAPTNR